MKTLIVSDAAARQLDELPADTREQIDEALTRYAMTGQGQVKSLTGRPGYRLRVGRYRVIFNEDQTTVLAIYIGKRETTIYRKH